MLFRVFDLFCYGFHYGIAKLMGTALWFYESFFIILFFSAFMKGARRTRASSFWHTFLQRLVTWSSNSKSLSIAIPRSISFHSVKCAQIRSFFWSVFSCIWTKHGDLRSKSPYSVRIQENTEQKTPYLDTFNAGFVFDSVKSHR